jgi:chromosome segregation ATPase
MPQQSKDQSEFDLDRAIEIFDIALTSNDDRVLDSFRKLMLIAVLTKHESDNYAVDRQEGPLAGMRRDLNHTSRKIRDLEARMVEMQKKIRNLEDYMQTTQKKEKNFLTAMDSIVDPYAYVTKIMNSTIPGTYSTMSTIDAVKKVPK